MNQGTIVHFVPVSQSALDLIYNDFIIYFSFLPVSSESGWTVTGQLSLCAVASIEAGVVPGVISTHRNRQLRPSGRRQ